MSKWVLMIGMVLWIQNSDAQQKRTREWRPQAVKQCSTDLRDSIGRFKKSCSSMGSEVQSFIRRLDTLSRYSQDLHSRVNDGYERSLPYYNKVENEYKLIQAYYDRNLSQAHWRVRLQWEEIRRARIALESVWVN